MLATVDLTPEEHKTVAGQIEGGSHMVAMIFKFYLQSGESDFFVRRLKNLVTIPLAQPTTAPSDYQP